MAIYAKGRVGFDRTLDFVIEPEFTEGTILEAPSTASHAQAILKAAGQLERFRRFVGRHRITGTIEDPQHRFETTLPGTLRQPVDLIDGLLDIFR